MSGVAGECQGSKDGMTLCFHHLSTRILVECIIGNFRGCFKALHGVTDRHAHPTNARMICAAAVLHNLLIDIGDDVEFEWTRDDIARKQAKRAFGKHWDRTQDDFDLGEAKRNAYMECFNSQDNE
ncbi:DDE superfamily endonuclease [Phytophthora infestans]|uniref:DDE superfamily endonuclease n=1 Tax=Phytophthora infestans TaxID=4787 RepID=A0A8S9U9Y4_PHYIN|nr:DDE superfamily endonuclease [Phytophthora infestans]